ncbi:membrane-anchored serine protease (Mycosin), MycP4 domain protein [Mycobacterium kansasii]|uniref:Membrane-anchored serine protease (Mycosin), MycP4 domain protein n=1 Tax=Mycobacterium kansasii TaxID=1768 RepID=A0A1V3XW77_MYCKA|nr:membrane-anchored serine protease (Mycosin), MycP4 domain protein [Mycobacterium kansasii]
MNTATVRLAHLLVAALTMAPLWMTPPAHAVSPPRVDEKWLPAATSPAPPRPTVQREVCTGATAVPGRDGAAAQLADLELPQLWQLTRGPASGSPSSTPAWPGTDDCRTSSAAATTSPPATAPGIVTHTAPSSPGSSPAQQIPARRGSAG